MASERSIAAVYEVTGLAAKMPGVNIINAGRTPRPWEAKVRRESLGTYSTEEEAYEVYASACRARGMTPRTERTIRLGNPLLLVSGANGGEERKAPAAAAATPAQMAAVPGSSPKRPAPAEVEQIEEQIDSEQLARELQRELNGMRSPRKDSSAAAASVREPVAEPESDDITCMTCGRADRGQLLVLCDGCENARHTFCCSPGLGAVPEDDWFCGFCAGSPAREPEHHADVVPQKSLKRQRVEPEDKEEESKAEEDDDADEDAGENQLWADYESPPSFVGVTWSWRNPMQSGKKKCVARIRVDNSCHHLGYFEDPEHAARAYDVAARK